jgi:hypothetical protein
MAGCKECNYNGGETMPLLIFHSTKESPMKYILAGHGYAFEPEGEI